MYNFMIIIDKPAMQFMLGFEQQSQACVARDYLRKLMDIWKLEGKDSGVFIEDDYGHSLDVYASNIGAVLIQDHQRSIERQHDQNIDAARAGEEFMKRRNDDVELIRLFPGQNHLPQGRLQ